MDLVYEIILSANVTSFKITFFNFIFLFQEQSPPSLPPKTRQVPLNNKNLNINHEFNRGLDRMSISTSGTSIRTAATRDRHSPLLR